MCAAFLFIKNHQNIKFPLITNKVLPPVYFLHTTMETIISLFLENNFMNIGLINHLDGLENYREAKTPKQSSG